MEIKIVKEEKGNQSDHLIKNVPDKAWNEFKRLATLNGLTVGKMFEILVTGITED